MAEVETLMVANHVEAINGLLYVSGGGWTDVWRGAVPAGQQPPPNHFGIAVAVSVGWTETNRPQHLVIRLEDEDGGEVFRGEADVEVGRPPGVPEGVDQRAVLALSLDLVFPRVGGYTLKAGIAGGHERQIAFRVHDRPPPAGG